MYQQYSWSTNALFLIKFFKDVLLATRKGFFPNITSLHEPYYFSTTLFSALK